MPSVIAYAYEADIHCADCAAKRFPTGHGTDREGNEIHPVFDTDEQDASGVYCGDCGDEISEPYDEQELLDVLREWSLDSSFYEDECGSATEGAGWACIFRNVTVDDLREARLYGTAKRAADRDYQPSFILTCDTQGFYAYEAFGDEDSDADVTEAWAQTCAELS